MRQYKQIYDLVINGILDAEGTYTVKAILDNGAYATATWEVKKFETPVSLKLTYSAPTVELGGVLYKDELMYVDVNGVEKDAANSNSITVSIYNHYSNQIVYIYFASFASEFQFFCFICYFYFCGCHQ